LATKACALTGWKSSYYLTTLAGAYAEQGNYREAITWQKKAIDLGFENNEEERVARKLLKSYQANKKSP
jgi:hypothetical protein